jgi:DNA-binding MarR family transcriptional regulator
MIDDRFKKLAFLLGHTGRMLKNDITKAFNDAGIDITAEQFSLLMFLWHKEGINQQEIADHIVKEKTTTLRIIDKLEERGFITRVKDKEDRRNNKIYLTDKGKNIREELKTIVDQIADKTFGILSDDEINNFEMILAKLYNVTKPENSINYECINFVKGK